MGCPWGGRRLRFRFLWAKEQVAANLIELTEYRDRIRIFRDRGHAGEVLAGLLAPYTCPDALLLAVPAGGVPVALEVATRLNLSRDLLMVSKITLPWNTEAGYGAVAFDGTVRINERLVRRLGLSREQVEQGVSKTREKVGRRLEILRGSRPLPDFTERPVIVVDDGLASGYTLSVVVEVLKKSGARKIIVAVPTGHVDAVERLAVDVESICCANVRGGWSFAVADAYRRWTDVSEDELREMAAELLGSPPGERPRGCTS
jgi:predicted phosphoribosyltransferase